MSFSSHKLSFFLQHAHQQPTGTGSYQVAFSGGLDSHVLLHALSSLADVRVAALHVDHGLHVDSQNWSAHCQRVCDALNIPLKLLCVDAAPQPGESPEAAARDARYQALAGNLAVGDVLLTAQHQDDQLETVLLQLLRGAGPKGLAGMPETRSMGLGHHLRPLLGFSRQDLAAYAEHEGLAWCEDPSNASLQFDRNFLRHEVIPRLQQRWPSVAATVSRSARLCAQSADALKSRAEVDLGQVKTDQPQVLSIPNILAFSRDRQTELLRLWFEQMQLQLPSEVLLKRVVNEVLLAQANAQPLVEWAEHSLRRYRDQLHLVFALPVAPNKWSLDWQGGQSLDLPGNLGSLRWLTDRRPQAGLRVVSRIGGERFRQRGRNHRHSLKKLLQDCGMPPWIRASLPLVYDGDELIAVPGLVDVENPLLWLDSHSKPWWG